MLGSMAPQQGWDDSKISTLLDDGERPAEIARRYWQFRAANAANLVDVTESGSSRKMSQVADNAQELAEYYAKVDAAANPSLVNGQTTTREIRRV